MLLKAIKSFFDEGYDDGVGLSSYRAEIGPAYFIDFTNSNANINTKIKINIKEDTQTKEAGEIHTQKNTARHTERSAEHKQKYVKERFTPGHNAEIDLSLLKEEITPAYFFSYANSKMKEEEAIEKHIEKKAVYVKERLVAAQNFVNELNLEDAYIKLSSLILELSSELSVKNDKVNKYYSFSNVVEEKMNSIINSKFETTAQTKWITAQGVSYTEIYALYIKVLIGLGKLDEAQTALKEAMRWNPVSCRIHILYSDYFKRQKRLKSCENALLRALEFATGTNALAECYFKLAYLKKQMGQKELASALYIQGSRFSKKHSMVKNANANGIELINEDKALAILKQNNIRTEAGKLVQSAYYNLMLQSKQRKNRKNFIYYLNAIKSMLYSKDKLQKLAKIQIPE